MKYIVPSSKIVFTDFMILLVSVLMGLNSTMSFSKEMNLPPVNLPEASDTQNAGSTHLSPVVITIDEKAGIKRYFYKNKEESLNHLFERIKNSKISTVVLRGDRKTFFTWKELVQLNAKLSKAGVKTISYAVTN